MLALVALCANLGQWQWDKAARKAAAQALLEARTHEPPLGLPATLVADAETFRYRRVAVRGQYRAAGQILLDNQTLGERVGYRVLTPFVIAGGAVEVMVDRGWIPADADRARLPDVAVPPVPQEGFPAVTPTFIEGIAVIPSDKHFALAADTAPPGDNARWQFLDLDRYARAAKTTLQPVVLHLDAEQPGGYLRVWPRPDERIERHRSYAFQWFGFAVGAVGIWAWFGFRRRA